MSFRIDEAVLDLNPRVVKIEGAGKGPKCVGWPSIQTRAEDLVKANGGCLEFDSEIVHRYGIIIDDDMLVVDVDVHDASKNGYAALEEIKVEYGLDLYADAAFVVKSPSGGCHLFFRKDPAVKLRKCLAEYGGLDFLTTGTQVIGAGSTHTSGGVYEVTRNGEPKQVDPRLIDIIKTAPSPKKEPVHVDADMYDSMKPAGLSPLDEFNTTAKGATVVKNLMESQGYTFTRKSDHFEYTRPNKTDFSHACSGTLGRVNSKGRPYLKNFSTSDGTFPVDSISFSEAYRLLRNISAHDLPVELSAEGFGEKRKFDQYADPMFHALFEGKSRHAKFLPKQTGEEVEKEYPTLSFDELVKKGGGKRREWIIENLLRRGEVANVIAAPKVGKSWLVYNLSLALACGKEFLGYRAAKNLRVLICDNELHPEELGWRVSQVANALGVNPEGSIEFNVLRGSDVDIEALDAKLDEIKASRFDIIVIDAFYRILPKGMSENDNGSMTQVFNKLDTIARKNECAIINIHHSSKGGQGDKAVTDVGAGAGAISRAADTHIAIREHLEEGLFIIDAVTRSGISPEPVSAKLEWPIWVKVDIDPIAKTFENARDKNNKDKKEKSNKAEEMIVGYFGDEPKTVADCWEELKLEVGCQQNTFWNKILKASKDGKIKRVLVSGEKSKNYISVTPK